MNYQRSYTPMRPIKSFQDLEVYQKLLAISVAVAKRISLGHSRPDRESICIDSHFPARSAFSPADAGGRGNDKLVAIVLDLPVKIATAHSLRFSDQTKAIQILEEIMLNCNVLVVYLEQYRDLENPSNVIPGTDPGSIQIDSGARAGMTIEPEFFTEQIKSILTVRGKILRLQFSWKKFSEQYKNQQNA